MTNFDRGVENVDWSVRSFTDTDTDESNNLATMSFIVEVTAVPTLSAVFMLLLIMVMLAGAVLRGRLSDVGG